MRIIEKFDHIPNEKICELTTSILDCNKLKKTRQMKYNRQASLVFFDHCNFDKKEKKYSILAYCLFLAGIYNENRDDCNR